MSGEVGYAMRNIKIYNFYLPLDRSLFLVGLKESWLACNSTCGRCPHDDEIVEDVEGVGGCWAAACPSAYEVGGCELTEARPASPSQPGESPTTL